jgi:hypothetical protein
MPVCNPEGDAIAFRLHRAAGLKDDQINRARKF